MNAHEYESIDVWFQGTLVGQLQHFPSGWFAWDELLEMYVYPGNDHRARWLTRHDALDALLRLITARRQVNALGTLIDALSIDDAHEN